MAIEGYDETLKEVVLYGTKFPLADLDDTEQAIFDQQFTSLIGSNSSVERELFEDRRSTIINGIRAIKYDQEKPAFRGLNPADSELGFGFIRPTHAKVAGSQLTVWGTSVTTSWADWLGSASSGVGYAISANAGMILVGFKSLTSPQPFLSEVNMKIGRTQLVPICVRSLQIGDNKNNVAFVAIPTIYALKREELLIRIRGDVAGTDYIVPLGFTVGLGRFLKAETATFIT